MSNSVKLTFGYKDTDFTRDYTFNGVADSVLSGVKANILNFNASISGGLSAAAGLSSFFISDDYNAAEGIGTFTGITAAQYTAQTVTEIDLT